jgi:hypothetical protein
MTAQTVAASIIRPIDEWEPLASHPHIQVQTMQWCA